MDLGSAATQMVLDIGFGVATGGGMALPAAIRTFGNSAAKAEMAGADLDQQMLYATTSAAASYGIEQMCNVAFAGLNLIAPGVSDDIVTAGVEKLAQKLASTPEGAQALTNIGKLIASGASEGVEETLESLLQPFLQQLSYDKSAQNVFQNPKLLADAVYEGVIGGILGMFGSGTNTAVDLVDNLIHNNIMPSEKLMEAAGVSESEVLGAMAMNEMGKMTEEDNIRAVPSVEGCDRTIKSMVNVDTVHLMESAKEGSRHGGVYRDAIGKKKETLEKSISSHTSQVLEHSEKIKHPDKYDAGWNEKDARQKEGLLRKWEKDLKRNAEQAEIEIEVWKEFYGNEY